MIAAPLDPRASVRLPLFVLLGFATTGAVDYTAATGNSIPLLLAASGLGRCWCSRRIARKWKRSE